MKMFVVIASIFASSVSFAGRDCTPHIITVGESGAATYVYPCGPNYTVNHRSCNEGEVAYSNEYGQSGELVPVTLVCRNGRFATTAPVQHRGCRNGEIAYSNEYGQSGELESVTLVCRNGRFVRR